MCCGLLKPDFHCEHLISFLFKLISVIIKIRNIFPDIKSLAGKKEVTQVLQTAEKYL